MTAVRNSLICGAISAAILLGEAGGQGRAIGGECRLVRYTFQVASRPSDAVPPGALELAPQIAVWIETSNGVFVDTLMVTSAVALHGIGNRPGRFDLPSGPKFPYGRRPMVLPVWAHARGHLYPSVVMEDADEADLMGHEATSSPEPYFCRPLLPSEVVDAVTCASGNFRSAKGVFASDGSTSYYPPRGDLFDVLGQPCPPLVNRPRGSCDTGDSPQFGLLDDVDAVAAATPAVDRTYSGTWTVPGDLPAAGYDVMVEVSKEFDVNSAYALSSSEGPVDTLFSLTYGQRGNLGQPSVVYRVPLTLAVGSKASTAVSLGHGDPLGDVGTIFSGDSSLSTDPGSGEGRLAVIAGPSGSGRVHVEVDSCPTPTCDRANPPPPVAADVLPSDVTPTSAVVQIRQEAMGSETVLGYDLRYRPLPEYATANLSEIPRWTPGRAVPVARAGAVSRAMLSDLAPGTGYVAAIRAKGSCGDSMQTLVRFFTPRMKFVQLSGCFIASAAFDDDTVDILRRGRDRAIEASGLAAAAVDIYYRSSPPLADMIKRSETARTLARGILGPVIAVARAVDLPRESGRHHLPLAGPRSRAPH
jgi:hypothetical protein